MKIIATTLGETLGDNIVQTLQLGYTIVLLVTPLFFLAVLSIQLFTKKYIPVFYWLVIIATTTLRTEISASFTEADTWGYSVGSVILFSCLAFTLLLWQKKSRI